MYTVLEVKYYNKEQGVLIFTHEQSEEFGPGLNKFVPIIKETKLVLFYGDKNNEYYFDDEYKNNVIEDLKKPVTNEKMIYQDICAGAIGQADPGTIYSIYSAFKSENYQTITECFKSALEYIMSNEANFILKKKILEDVYNNALEIMQTYPNEKEILVEKNVIEKPKQKTLHFNDKK